MSEYTRYWIWLQQSIGYANAKVRTILKFYPTIKDFYDGGRQEWILCGCFTKKEINNLEAYSLAQAQNIIDKCDKLDYKIIAIDDELYPRRLLEIFTPPTVLYVSGTLPLIDTSLCIAMVGTRNMTPSGKRSAFTIAANLSQSGVVVVSGGAVGVDSASHRGVLQANGVTVCVLGCGINHNYLSANAPMRKQITLNGAVISEYPPDTPPTRYTFPMRNRIISGLCQGTLVVEAGEKSGALITADFALEQNRDVFAIPGDITNATCFGTNNLIKQGAKPVTTYTDILEEYSGEFTIPQNITLADGDNIPYIPTAKKKQSIHVNKPSPLQPRIEKGDKSNTRLRADVSQLSDNAQKIYNYIYNSPCNIDDIINETGLPVSVALSALTELELFQIIERRTGRMYHAL
ncbi:MAG TPA: DNA-protecting protein DprA [Clostridiales bacterium]|nr:DNA-protecting protein DprA [Clostridiales bacterium]